LVAKGIFNEAFVSFLLVGHTHDDIDAFWAVEHETAGRRFSNNPIIDEVVHGFGKRSRYPPYD
jgi:hypothetical protein